MVGDGRTFHSIEWERARATKEESWLTNPSRRVWRDQLIVSHGIIKRKGLRFPGTNSVDKTLKPPESTYRTTFLVLSRIWYKICTRAWSPFPLIIPRKTMQVDRPEWTTLSELHEGAHPPPLTLNPQPSTLNPQPSTLNPPPSTLDREEKSESYKRARATRKGSPSTLGAISWERGTPVTPTLASSGRYWKSTSSHTRWCSRAWKRAIITLPAPPKAYRGFRVSVWDSPKVEREP